MIILNPTTKNIAIHSGGLQGVLGMNLKLEKKNYPYDCIDEKKL